MQSGDAITWGNPIGFADGVHTNTNPRPDFEFTHFGPPIQRSTDTVCGYSACSLSLSISHCSLSLSPPLPSLSISLSSLPLSLHLSLLSLSLHLSLLSLSPPLPALSLSPSLDL